MTKITQSIGAQGEIRIFGVDDLPASGLLPLQRENGHMIIGHSETGHHHVLVADRAQVSVSEKAPEGTRILYAILESPGELKHLREHDTHKSHHFPAGSKIMFRTDREFDPYAELARRSMD